MNLFRDFCKSLPSGNHNISPSIFKLIIPANNTTHLMGISSLRIFHNFPVTPAAPATICSLVTLKGHGSINFIGGGHKFFSVERQLSNHLYPRKSHQAILEYPSFSDVFLVKRVFDFSKITTKLPNYSLIIMLD